MPRKTQPQPLQEVVEAEGHLIDSHIMEQIFDTVIEHQGRFEVEHFHIGRTNADPSRLRLRVESPDRARFEKMLAQLHALGCAPVEEQDARFARVERDRCAPEDFYSTTNHRTLVRRGGQWHEVRNQRMDAVIVWEDGQPWARRLRDIRAGDEIVVGMQGIRVIPESKERDRLAFAFMSNGISSERQVETAVRQTAALLGRGLLVLLATLLLVTGYWAVVRADSLRAYPTNPRRVIAERQLVRGRILGRSGEVLARSVPDAQGYMRREYPYPDEAAPVIGYADLKLGTSALEAVCNAALRGEVNMDWRSQLWRDLIHAPQRGQDVSITLDSRLQILAQRLLAGQRGAIVLVDTHTGAVLALASAPTYAPERIAEDWDELRASPDAPLLNRATQGLTQPGGALSTVILGLALQRQLDLTLREDFTRTITLEGVPYACQGEPTPDWAGLLRAQCPAPLVSLADQLGYEHLVEGLTAWGLTQAPAFDLPTVGHDWHPRRMALDAEALGQGDLLVTPLHLAGVVAVLGNDGVRPPLHLLREAQPGCTVPARTSQRLLSADEAAFLRGTWSAWGVALGHLSQAQAGPGRTVSWFLGLNSAQVPRYGVVVMLDNPPSPSYAARIAQILLYAATGP